MNRASVNCGQFQAAQGDGEKTLGSHGMKQNRT